MSKTRYNVYSQSIIVWTCSDGCTNPQTPTFLHLLTCWPWIPGCKGKRIQQHICFTAAWFVSRPFLSPFRRQSSFYCYAFGKGQSEHRPVPDIPCVFFLYEDGHHFSPNSVWLFNACLWLLILTPLDWTSWTCPCLFCSLWILPCSITCDSSLPPNISVLWNTQGSLVKIGCCNRRPQNPKSKQTFARFGLLGVMFGHFWPRNETFRPVFDCQVLEMPKFRQFCQLPCGKWTLTQLVADMSCLFAPGYFAAWSWKSSSAASRSDGSKGQPGGCLENCKRDRTTASTTSTGWSDQ